MDLGLRGRTALVTGSSDGIGREIAFRLAEEGANIIVHGRNPEKVDAIVKSITLADRITAFPFVADVTKPEQIENWFKTRMSQVGQLDILINNIGGIAGVKKFEEVSDEEWYDSFTFNLMSPVRFIRLALPYLKKSDQARIINIGTDTAIQPGLINPHYTASKTALVNLSESLSKQFAKDGILVNVVCPKSIRGGAWHRKVEDISKAENLTLEAAEQKLEDLTKIKIPLKRVGTMAEVADTVVFLASKRASFITGECIFIDGGTKGSIF